MLIIPALGKQDCEFKARLGYILKREREREGKGEEREREREKGGKERERERERERENEYGSKGTFIH
jgi:hypothetical protein